MDPIRNIELPNCFTEPDAPTSYPKLGELIEKIMQMTPEQLVQFNSVANERFAKPKSFKKWQEAIDNLESTSTVNILIRSLNQIAATTLGIEVRGAPIARPQAPLIPSSPRLNQLPSIFAKCLSDQGVGGAGAAKIISDVASQVEAMPQDQWDRFIRNLQYGFNTIKHPNWKESFDPNNITHQDIFKLALLHSAPR